MKSNFTLSLMRAEKSLASEQLRPRSDSTAAAFRDNLGIRPGQDTGSLFGKQVEVADRLPCC